MRHPLPITLLALSACQPPAADDYLERGLVEETVPNASAPLSSPDAEGALWAPSQEAGRLLYGIPGKTPFLAMQCDTSADAPMLAFTRFAPADRDAKAMMSLVGNFHAVRFPVDATSNGRAWLWRGSINADHPELEALTGRRAAEATVPGAGSVMLNPSPLARDLINACRAYSQAEPMEPDPVETDLAEPGAAPEPVQ